jgi:glycosyltransferase involved in cell wall biosynthesis
MVKWDTPLTAGFRHTYLSTDSKIQSADFWNPTASGLKREFLRFHPDVVLLTAYAGRFNIGAWWAARAVGAKVIIRHEASDVAVLRSRWKSWCRDLLLRQLYARIDGFAVIGIEASRHLLRLGVAREKMERAPYCVDSDFFAGETVRWLAQRDTLRRECGVAESDIVLVFSGKLIPKKDPLLIISALARLEPVVRARIHLLVAGDGELREVLAAAGREHLGDRLHLFGFLNQTEIGRVYACGDVLVLPSQRGAGETWGLVVNEAMQFGLFPLVSDGVGCAHDLVVGDGGEVFESGSAEQLEKAIRIAVASIDSRGGQIRARVRERAESHSCAVAAAGIAMVVRKVFL